MLEDTLTRRAFVAGSCTAIASSWMLAEPAQLRQSLAYAARVVSLPAPRFEFLTREQAADIDAIAAQIIPTDDTPGAHEAGVVHFIDHSLSTWAVQLREPVLQGLEDLTRRVNTHFPAAGRFAGLNTGQQRAVLEEIQQTPFFQTIRVNTVLGMFALPSYGGNVQTVGWQLIGFDNRHTWQPPFGAYDAEVAVKGAR